jgi:hypothetical protein
MPSVSALPGSGPIYGTGTSDYSKNQNVTKEFKSYGGTLGYGYAGDQELNAYAKSLPKPSPAANAFGLVMPSLAKLQANSLAFAKNKQGFYNLIKNNPNLARQYQGGLKGYLGKSMYQMLIGNMPQTSLYNNLAKGLFF